MGSQRPSVTPVLEDLMPFQAVMGASVHVVYRPYIRPNTPYIDNNKIILVKNLLFPHYFQLHLPLNSPLPGSELTKEPFRWDQRLFALVLRLPGTMSVESEQLTGVPLDDSAITPMCEVTGGKVFAKSNSGLKQFI